MARYDKYDPEVANFRAPLAADWLAADVNTIVPVSLDANGRVIKGGPGNSGLCGVVVLTKVRRAGDIVDVMRHGEIVEADIAGPNGAASGLVAGTTYYGTDAAALTDVAPAAGVNATEVGFTVEASRLIVDVHQVQG